MLSSRNGSALWTGITTLSKGIVVSVKRGSTEGRLKSMSLAAKNPVGHSEMRVSL